MSAEKQLNGTVAANQENKNGICHGKKKTCTYFMIFDVVFQKEWIWTAPWNTVFGCCWK